MHLPSCFPVFSFRPLSAAATNTDKLGVGETIGIKKILACVLLFAGSLHAGDSQSGNPINLPRIDPAINWFYQAKLGVFLHWGIYAVDGVEVSWPFNHPPESPHGVSYDKYFAQMKGFGAQNYDPVKWAEIFREAGAKYAIITTKHHDGFALWDTKVPDGLDAAGSSPAARDLIKPWIAAMRAADIHPGFYFSIADWHHPDYPSMEPPAGSTDSRKNLPYSYGEKDDPARWAKYLKFMNGQLDELLEYNPDIWWFDGGWERTAEEWDGAQITEKLTATNPNMLLGRHTWPVKKGVFCYNTPERAVPARTPTGLWELCLTSNEHWAYCPTDTQWKPADVLVQIFADVISRGGNLLLNIAPKADGSLPEEATGPLLDLGAWIKRNQEAISPTFGGEQAGISFTRFHGPSTVSMDGKTLYLFVPAMPEGGILLRGVVSVPKRVSVVSTGEESVWRQLGGVPPYQPGDFLISAPKKRDSLMTVIKLEYNDIIHLEGTVPTPQRAARQ